MALLHTARVGAILLLVDAALLAALARVAPALARAGPAAPWLEAATRFPALTAASRLLAPGGPRGAAAALAVAPAIVITIWSLLVGAGAAPALLATAAPLWVALTHGTVTAVLLARAAVSPGWESPPGPVWQLLVLAWTERRVLGAAFVFLALAVLGEMAGPYCTGKALDAVRAGAGLGASAAALVLAADAGSVLFGGCRGGLFILAMARLTHSTRHRLFHNLVRQDLAFLQATPPAELCARLGSDVPLLCRAVPLSVNVALRSLLKVLGLGGFMAGLSPRLTLLAALEAPLVVAARRAYDARQQVLQRALLDATAATAATVQEAVSAIETVRSFAGEEEEERRHGRAVAEMLRLKNQIDTERALFILVKRVLQLAVQVLVLWHGRRLLGEGSVSAGSLVTFLLYQARVGREVQALVFGHGDLRSKAAAGGAVLGYLAREPTGDAGGPRAPATLRGHVAFRRVSFAFPARPERPVLQDVSFELRPGEVTALAGLNGSGKSTCAALLARLYEPDAGEVLLDGAPLREYQHQYLHRQVVLVPQEPVLFSGTVRDNITFGLEGCGDQEVTAAADAAGALGFISALERGFDTAVGDQGAQLSAGEKQRVALARALLRRPAVLILDEPTSALPGDGAAALRRWVRECGAPAVLLVTHCPRLLEAAERVVVLRRGAVAEEGTPAELRRRRGIYSQLLRRRRGADATATIGEGGDQ